MKVALLGVGGMGFVHYNEYKKMDNVDFVAACDIRFDMLKEKAGDDKIKLYDDFDKMLEAEKPDIVDICTPSYLHPENIIKALEFGCNVISEKPLALTGEEAQRVVDTVNKTGKLFMVAHVVRFMNPYKYLKSIIDSKELGDLLRLDMKRISSIPTWSYNNWMRDTTKSGGTPMDFMIHDVDFMQYSFGMPKDIDSVVCEMKNNNDFVSATYYYDGFAVTTYAGWYNTDMPFDASYYAIFQNGYVKLNDGIIIKNGEEIKLDAPADEKVENTGINISGVDGYGGELRYFVDCVEKGVKPTMVTADSSANSVKLVEKTVKKAKRI